MEEGNHQAKQGSEAAAFRRTLRRERIRAREALSGEEHARLSAAVRGHLHEHLARRQPALLAFYWPIRAEVDCRPLTAELIARGWRACLPVIVEREAVMAFRQWTPETPVAPGEHGIPTVASGPFVLPDVLLLPVNAFDREGYRLGYGGGYFDRTLAAMAHRPYVIGVGFELARADSIGPHAQDFGMDAVATERGVEVFSGSVSC